MYDEKRSEFNVLSRWATTPSKNRLFVDVQISQPMVNLLLAERRKSLISACRISYARLIHKLSVLSD